MSENKRAVAVEPFREPDAVEMEALEEWSWVLKERGEGRFDEYAGQHVAVVNKVVLGSNPDPYALEKYLAEHYQIDPRRIVMFFVDDGRPLPRFRES